MYGFWCWISLTFQLWLCIIHGPSSCEKFYPLHGHLPKKEGGSHILPSFAVPNVWKALDRRIHTRKFHIPIFLSSAFLRVLFHQGSTMSLWFVMQIGKATPFKESLTSVCLLLNAKFYEICALLGGRFV